VLGTHRVPEISRFFGIVIRMYFLDHDPPHFHATYGEAEALVRITPRSVIRGSLPPRALALVMEWASIRQEALLANWHRLRHDQLPDRIAPLE
jgi:hypothetical protein